MGRKKETTFQSFKVRVSTNALHNIDEITGYISFINHQPLNAIKVADSIFSTFDKIAQNPFAYRECTELPTKTKIYRRAICHSWLIIYKIAPPEIIILGILHASRKPSAIKILKKIR